MPDYFELCRRFYRSPRFQRMRTAYLNVHLTSYEWNNWTFEMTQAIFLAWRRKSVYRPLANSVPRKKKRSA